jgi:assimilatory nitrate reductase catalytic subunit
MGFVDAFSFGSRAEIFREHAALSTFENHNERLFDLGALSDLSDDDYEAMVPAQWPARKGTEAGGRLLDQRFPTPDGLAKVCGCPAGRPGQVGGSRLPHRAELGASARPVAHDDAHRSRFPTHESRTPSRCSTLPAATRKGWVYKTAISCRS